MINQSWWKILTIILLLYTFIAGLLIKVPSLDILHETIRNLFFHVPMWFGMMILLVISVIYSILFLRKHTLKVDIIATEYAKTGLLFGMLGLITGAIWANYTWGKPWSNDPKQLGAAIAILIYAAYFVLRNSITDIDKRAKVAAVYNIFAFAMLFPTLWIIPRMVESLHPGGQGVEGNPGINGSDLDPSMRIVFWPAVAGWTLLGVWITTLKIRFGLIKEKQLSNA